MWVTLPFCTIPSDRLYTISVWYMHLSLVHTPFAASQIFFKVTSLVKCQCLLQAKLLYRQCSFGLPLASFKSLHWTANQSNRHRLICSELNFEQLEISLRENQIVYWNVVLGSCRIENQHSLCKLFFRWWRQTIKSAISFPNHLQ